MEQLELNAVVQRYGATTIVDGVDFKLAAGQIACLLGPSGCGKTTLLRCIAGFEEIAGGEIRLHGDVVSRKGQRLAPEKRRIGMVFQDYALFPHLNVEDNVAFGIRKHPQRERIVRELLELVMLDQPFSNLDVELRRKLSHEVRDILKVRGTSAVLVTHDQEEAFAVSDHVGVFQGGRLEQWDTPFNLYHEPLTP